MLGWCLKSHALSLSICHKVFALKEGQVVTSSLFTMLSFVIVLRSVQERYGTFTFFLFPGNLLLPPWPCQVCPAPRFHVWPSHPQVLMQQLDYIRSHPQCPPVVSSDPCLQGITVPIQSGCPGFLSGDRPERGQCMLKFQLQKKPRCHEAASIPLRNVDMPSHLSCRCAQHYFPWPVQFQFLERDSPDLICFHMHFLLSSCTAALAVIRWLSWLWHSCLHLCPSLSAPLEYTSWSSTCKPPSFIPLPFWLYVCPSPAPTFSLPRHSWKYISLIF